MPANEADIDQSISKVVGLAVFGVASALAFSYFLKNILNREDYNSFILSLIAVSLFLTFFLLQSIFIKSVKTGTLIAFIETICVSFFFYDEISQALALGIIFMFLTLTWANYSGTKSLSNSLKVEFFRVSKAVLPKAITSLALFVSVIYFLHIQEASLKDKSSLFISSSSFEKILAPTTGLVQGIIPGFSFSAPVGKVSEDLARNQVAKMPQSNLLPDSVKELVVVKTAKDLQDQVAGIIGMPINTNSNLADIIYTTLAERFVNLPDNIKTIIILSYLVIIFLTLKSVGWFLRVIISAFAFLIYEFLLAVKFANITLEGRSKEIITLK